MLLHKLNVDAPYELLDKAYGLSLSDQYWLKPEDMNIRYDDINFFNHDFTYSEFLQASLSTNNGKVKYVSSLITPNNTTDGMLKKAWIIDSGVRYLLKGRYKNETLQPFNEVLACEICERLGFDHVPYTLDIYSNSIVSKCPCFITKDTEFITAYQILHSLDKQDYEMYIQILESQGIENARIQIENMFVLDFLMMNEDRHLNNFGIIRDVNTLKWLGVAPIFDNGQSLHIEYYDENEMHVAGQAKFFNTVCSFDEMIQIVKDIHRMDISQIENLPLWFDKLLHEYQSITGYSDLRIQRFCILLNRQIQKLKKWIELNKC